MNASEIVTNAIDGVLDPTAKLKDVLLKLKTVAYLIENPELKNWVELELNGYYGKDVVVPEYRKVGAIPRGNLTTKTGSAWQNDQPLLTEYMGEKIHELITHRHLNQSVAELEHLLEQSKGGGEIKIQIAHVLHRDITEIVYAKNGWYIHTAWQLFSPTSFEGVLTSIRSKILDLLMPLKVAFGDDIPLQSLQQKKTVNDTVNKALHSINVAKGGIVNVAHGDSAVQATNTGQGAINAATGSNTNQSISGEQSTSLKELVKEIEQIIASESAFESQRDEMSEELKRVDVQLKREEPKKGIIKRSFESLKDLAADAAGATAGHAVFELIRQGLELSQ